MITTKYNVLVFYSPVKPRKFALQCNLLYLQKTKLPQNQMEAIS